MLYIVTYQTLNVVAAGTCQISIHVQYGQAGCIQINPLIGLFTTSMVENSLSISNDQCILISGEVSLLSDYKGSAGGIPHPHQVIFFHLTRRLKLADLLI